MPELGMKETDEKSVPGEECYSLVGMLSKEISQRNGSASNISSCNDIQMTSTCNFGEKSDAKVVEKKIICESDTIVEVETQSLSSSKCKEQSSVKRKFGHLTFRRRKKSLTESVTPSLSSKNTSSSSLTPSSSTSSCTSTTSTSKTSVSKKEGKENSTKKKSSRITTGWGLGLNRLCARTDSCADVAVESSSGDGTSDSCICTAYKRTEEHHLGSGLVFGHPSENSIIVKDNNKSDSSKQINKLEEKKSNCDSSKVSQESIRSDEASVRTCETNIGCASSSNYHHNNYDEATIASTSTSTVMSTVQVRVSELALALRSQLALTVSPYPYLAKWGEVNDNTSGFWNRLVRNDSANNGNAIDSNVNNSNVNNSNMNNSNMNNSNNATINSTTSNSTSSSNSNQISHVNSDFDADHNVSNMNGSESMSTSEVDMSSMAAQQQVHTQIDYIHCLVPDLLQITNCSFYWGKMDRYEAEKLLENRPEGTFLLRDSAQEEHLFSVSFRRFDRSLHARIEQWSHRFSFDSHDPGVFSSPTVCGLIEHYKDPSHCMFFEPMLTIPLNRNNAFSLQHTARAVICSHLTYDTIQTLQLPKRIKNYLKEYHYKQQVRVRRLDGDGDH